MMYILINKERDTDDSVAYRATMNVPSSSYLSRSGKTRYELEAKIGCFLYDKVNGELVFASDSDPYYLESELVRFQVLVEDGSV